MLRTAAAVLAFLVVAIAAHAVEDEVSDRRQDGFCRRNPGIAGAVTYEERTWWPLGERCFIELDDGTVLTREPRWWLTVFAAGFVGVVAAGATAPAGTRRRALALLVGAPRVALAVLVVLVARPASLTRVVAITTVSLTLAVLPAAATAAGIWWMARGRVLLRVIGAWTTWAALIFLMGRDGLSP